MELVTERLRLREFTDADWPAVLAYQCLPLYLRYYDWESRTPDEVRRFVRMFIDWQGETPRARWQLAIELPEVGRLIGNCGVRRRSATAPEAELGYELDPAWWGRGYATEAARAMVGFGFEHLGLQRIVAECLADNTASARVLERVGLRLTRRLPDHRRFKGRAWDGLEYAVTAEQWRALQPADGARAMPAAGMPPPAGLRLS